LAQIASALRNRHRRDRKRFQKVTDSLATESEQLEARAAASAELLRLLDAENASDLEKLRFWADEAATVENNILELLKCSETDEAKIKGLHLRLEKVKKT